MLVQLIVLSVVHTIYAELEKPYYDLDNLAVVSRHFEQFIADYSRTYKADEKNERFKLFHDNLRRINELNEESESATFGINQFADKSFEENMKYLGYKPKEGDSGNCQEIPNPPTKPAPEAWDWRDQNLVSPLRDQSDCGSCWAMSTVGMLESRYLAKNRSVSLSAQQLVDCDRNSSGCSGGYMTSALTTIMNQGGIESEESYPYKVKEGQCRFDKNKVVANVASCRTYKIANEDKLKELLYQEGPLSLGVFMDLSWFKYKGGVFDKCVSVQTINHAVVLVGYGTENGKNFWVIKNSYGKDYGEQGFIRVLRGKGCWALGSQDYGDVVSASV